MARRRVAKGKAARERRYESAVYRQIALVDNAFRQGSPQRYLYAGPEEFVRREDDLVMFTEDGTR